MLSDKKLKVILDRLYYKYNRKELIGTDPLMFVYEYDLPADREIAGFLASSLAYGRVAQIQASVRKLLELIGNSPYDFVMSFSKKDSARLLDFKHRFNTGKDISDLLTVLKHALRESGSLESFFLEGFSENDDDVLSALAIFTESLIDIYKKNTKNEVGRGFKYLLASPKGNSPCKRLNMFLRWMVRSDDVDPGVWKSVPASKLIIPVDTHIGRLAKILGFNDKKTVSIKTAREITRSFARLSPEDPVKYDFSLTRIGIVENCNGQINQRCKDCELFPLCNEIRK